MSAIESLRQQKLSENEGKCDQCRENRIFSVTFNNVRLWFRSDRKTQMDLQSVLILFRSGMHEYDWTDEEGTKFTFTTSGQVVEVLKELLSRTQVIYDRWYEYKQQIEEASTVDELMAINITYN